MKTLKTLLLWRFNFSAAPGLVLGWVLALTASQGLRAQGELGAGSVAGSGAGPYSYALSFSNGAGATAAIGSVWYSWIPGFFYLPGVPTNPSAPAGWTATVSANSVQYVASGPASYIAAGQTLSGFGYQAAFSPAQLAAAPNSGVSVAYAAGLFSDPGNTFTVQAVPAPEPTGPWLMVCGAGVLWLGRGVALGHRSR